MALLRTAMDSAFGNLNISSTETLVGGCAKAVPGEPFPVDGARASRAIRIQQLAIMHRGFPLGLIPSYSPTPHKDLGSFSLQALRAQVLSNWWLALVTQIRPQKLISGIKAELSTIRISKDWDWDWDWDLTPLKASAKRLLEKSLDKSLYSLGLCLQASLTSSSSFLLSSEAHGESNRRRTRAMLLHKLPNHDITMEAGWPELYIDHNGKYWEVPLSISLDCTSLISDSGLRYRFGVQKNGGYPQAVDTSPGEVPLALMPGLCAKVAFSFEKSKDLWRQKETDEDLFVRASNGSRYLRPAYDIRLKEPFAAISGIIGGICAAWIGGGESSAAFETRESGDSISLCAKKRSPFSADMFGSVCFTHQHGKFRKLFGDLTRLDARLDICSASALASKIFRSYARSHAENPMSSPRLNLIFQQQVYGPIVFQVNSKFSLGSSAGKGGVHMEDLIYSLNYSLRLLQSGKVVAWYSPKRKEAMVELRLFEF